MVYIIIAVFAALTVMALYNGLTVREYSVCSTKIKNPVKIVLVSDVHSMKYGQKKLLRLIKMQKPDMIALAGDIFDSHGSEKYAEQFLKGLDENVLTFYVTGNHEHKTGRLDSFLNIVKSFKHIHILDADKEIINIKGNRICVGGISDPAKKKADDTAYDYKKALEDIGNNGSDSFNILIAHNPFYSDDYKKYDFDLVLSGHTHGGQIRVPFILNGLYNRSWGFFPPYCGGMYVHDKKMTHIVCRGAANNPAWCPRIFNRRDIAGITVMSGKQ